MDLVEAEQRLEVVRGYTNGPRLDPDDLGERPVHSLRNLLLRQIGATARSPKLSPKPPPLDQRARGGVHRVLRAAIIIDSCMATCYVQYVTSHVAMWQTA